MTTEVAFNMAAKVGDDVTILRCVSESFLWFSALRFAIVTFKAHSVQQENADIWHIYRYYRDHMYRHRLTQNK